MRSVKRRITCFGQPGPGAIIGDRVAPTRLVSQGRQQHHNSRHGCHTTALLGFVKHLREKSPQRDGRRINRVFLFVGRPQRNALFRKRPLDLFFGQHIAKRQAIALEKRGKDEAKPTCQSFDP